MSAENTEVTTQAGGVAEEAAPLAAVFPGEAITLSTGRVVVVKPWGMKALTKEVPAMLGKVMARLGPLAEGAKLGLGAADLVPILMEKAGEEIMNLVAWSAGITPEEFEVLPAGDGMRLLRAVVRLNRDFFGEAVLLYQEFGVELGANG